MKKTIFFLILFFIVFSNCKYENKKNNVLEEITISFSSNIDSTERHNSYIQRRVKLLKNFKANDSLPSFLYYDEDNQFASYFHEILDTNISSKKEIFSKITNTIVLEEIVNSSSFIYDSLDTDIPKVKYQKYSTWAIAKARLNELQDSINNPR